MESKNDAGTQQDDPAQIDASSGQDSHMKLLIRTARVQKSIEVQGDISIKEVSI